MTTKGTKEWSDWNLNVYKGCSNNCRYCYAKFMALRFKRIKSEAEWAFPVLNRKVVHQSFRKRKGRGMFPTTHDITPQTYMYYSVVLLRLLRAGNEVLITSKPNFVIIKMLCKRIMMWTDKIQFRFTITSMNDGLLKYWEEGAPNYQSRKDSLIYAFRKGFKTSVSIEPYLGIDPIPLIKDIALYCSESIWIGIMNPKYYNFNFPYLYTDKQVRKVVNDIKKLPENILKKIRLKDSIINMGISL